MMKAAIFLLASATLFAGAMLRTPINPASPADQPPLDMVISGGRVMDPESGLDAVRNVGIRDGKIVEISEKTLKGKQIVDAHGLVVAPGFIDLHEHGQEPRNYEFQAHDGVTTSLELEVGTDDVPAGMRDARENH
jgi:N-acyl-D-aspartate/D-glutamate deacylase